MKVDNAEYVSSWNKVFAHLPYDLLITGNQNKYILYSDVPKMNDLYTTIDGYIAI